MKIQKNFSFQPINITIETKEELDHLLAALNTTSKTLEEQASSMGSDHNLKSFKANGQVYGQMFFEVSKYHLYVSKQA
jgi:hypothetical protein